MSDEEFHCRRNSFSVIKRLYGNREMVAVEPFVLHHAVKNHLGLPHRLSRESTQLYIHIVVRIICYEFLICSAALFGGLSNRIIQGATENTRTDQRERNTVQPVVHQHIQRIIVGIEQFLEGCRSSAEVGPTAWMICLALVMLNAGVITADPSLSGVLYLLQAAVRALIPAFLKMTPQIYHRPPTNRY